MHTPGMAAQRASGALNMDSINDKLPRGLQRQPLSTGEAAGFSTPIKTSSMCPAERDEQTVEAEAVTTDSLTSTSDSDSDSSWGSGGSHKKAAGGCRRRGPRRGSSGCSQKRRRGSNRGRGKPHRHSSRARHHGRRLGRGPALGVCQLCLHLPLTQGQLSWWVAWWNSQCCR